jgi:TolA-binding protein
MPYRRYEGDRDFSQTIGLVPVLDLRQGFRSLGGNRMKKRIVRSAGMACVLFGMLLGSASAQAASQKTVNHFDIMLFQQAQRALKQSNYVEARSLLETLINTYPDSDYVPRAKLSIADSWYSQHAFKQAKLEYQDIITFFPNRPEVAEAQRRINSIQKDSE